MNFSWNQLQKSTQKSLNKVWKFKYKRNVIQYINKHTNIQIRYRFQIFFVIMRKIHCVSFNLLF